MSGGSFPLSPCVSRYSPSGQARLGLVPEVSASSCSLKCLCKAKAGYGMDGEGSRCEASSWGSGRLCELEVLRNCCTCHPSSWSGAGDHLVLNRPKSSDMMDAFSSPCMSWNGENSLSAYIDAYLPYESLAHPDFQLTSANPESKADDASSHNNNNNTNMLCRGSGELEAANDGDVEVGLSESINDSLLARGEEGMKKSVGVGKGSKRKAAESVKNPRQNESRIVRVSRLTGGKDRHSKVRTARGLRDRRVRLSVPTAIQFYDLQDRLGFDQPSMAVDWLINNAKAAIDNLPSIAHASNNISYSNCSPVKSPKDSATAQVTANEVEGTIHEQLPIRTSKSSYVGRSSSSTSDGTEYSSKLARLKVARERARKKARNSAASSQVPMLQSCASHGTVPQESYGILSGTSTLDQLWDCSTQEISCKEHSRQFQHMAAPSLSSTLTTSVQQQSSAEMLRSSSHQNFGMADLTSAFVDPKQTSVAGNAAHIYLNSLIDYQSQKHLGSTFVPGISSGLNFTTSDHSSRGPLQSNSSCITTGNSPLLQKNAFADASAKVSMLPFVAYDTRIPERFQTYFLDGNVKYGLNH